jgi:hypothetical protein
MVQLGSPSRDWWGGGADWGTLGLLGDADQLLRDGEGFVGGKLGIWVAVWAMETAFLGKA